MNSITKKCRKCGEVKELLFFYKHKGCKDGYQQTCIECTKKHQQLDRQKRKEFYKEKQKQSYEKHKDKRSAWSKKYHEIKKDIKAAYSKLWREKNRDTLLQSKKEYYYKNYEDIKNKKKDNRLTINMSNLIYYHTKRANGGTFTRKEWLQICSYYGEKCLKCGKNEVTIDHVIPVSCGGKSSIDNIQPLCRSCNSSKNNKEIDYRFDKGEYARKIMDNG